VGEGREFEGRVVVFVVATGPLTLIPNASPYHSERRTRSVVLLVVVLGPARGDPDVDVKRNVLGAVSVVVFLLRTWKIRHRVVSCGVKVWFGRGFGVYTAVTFFHQSVSQV